MKIKSRRAVLVLLIAGAVVAAGVLYLVLRRSAGSEVLTLYGDVDIREAQPAFYDTGPVTQLLVSEGARVRKGELIARIDDSRYVAALAQARQQADNLKAVLTRLLHGSRPDEIARDKATMAGLEAVYENARIAYTRTVSLLPHGVVSTQDRDDAQATVRAARDNYEAARRTYVLAAKGPRAEDITAARHAYKAAVAAAAYAQQELLDTKLYAPVDGVIENRILEPGDMASPGTPVYTIALTNPLWVRAYVPETDLGRIRFGMPATVSTDSYPGRVYHGWIGYLSPTAEFTPKNIETPQLRTALVYQLRVYVCDAREELRLGMPATVHIDLTGKGAAMTPGCGPSHAAEP
jgi:HlyD family secretion protein